MENHQMTTDETVLAEVRRISQDLSNVSARQRTKFTGALTVEIVRNRLIGIGLPVSSRDIYIRGHSSEFDLAVVRDNANPKYGILYEPADVAAIIEVKYSGVYSKEVPETIKRLFDEVHEGHPHIVCVYLSVSENPSFNYRIMSNTLGHPAFTLYWVNRSDEILKIGDPFESFASTLRNALQQLPSQ
jgi:hypothetical protein